MSNKNIKSQFLLCENPKLNLQDDQFIYHSKTPRFFAKILAFQDDFDIAIQEHFGENITFFYINQDSIREVHTLVAVEMIDDAEPAAIQSKLKRMADWYIDYLMWEDRENNGKAGTTKLLVDFNENTNGLKILLSKSSNKYCIIYKGIVKVFNSEIEVKNYLISDLKFQNEQIENGNVNGLR